MATMTVSQALLFLSVSSYDCKPQLHICNTDSGPFLITRSVLYQVKVNNYGITLFQFLLNSLHVGCGGLVKH